MNEELRKNIRHTLWFCAIPKKGGECQHLSYDEGAEEVIDKIMATLHNELAAGMGGK